MAAHEAKFDSDWLTSLIANSLLFDRVVAFVFAVGVGLTVAVPVPPSVVGAVDDEICCCGGARGNLRRNLKTTERQEKWTEIRQL